MAEEAVHRAAEGGSSGQPPGAPARWVVFGALGAGLAIFAMGQTILFAVLGPLAREIGLTEIQVGLMVSLAAAIIALVSPYWGTLSDRWGRRAVLVFGLVSYGVTMLLFTTATVLGLEGVTTPFITFWAMTAARVLYAFLSAGIQPAATALVADMTKGKDRASGMALVGASFGLGTVGGPAFAAALSYLGLIAPLVAVSALALLSGLAIAVLLPRRTPSPANRTRGRLKLWDRRVLPFILLMFCVLIAGSAAQQTLAFYLQDRFSFGAAETARHVGFVMAASAAAMILAQGGIVQIFKPQPSHLVRAGFAAACLGFIVLSAGLSYVYTLTGYILVGFGLGFLNPGLLAAASVSVREREQGAMAGLMGAAMAAGFAFGPLLGTSLYTLSPMLPFYVNAVFTGILFLVSWRVRFFRPGLRRRHDRSQKKRLSGRRS